MHGRLDLAAVRRVAATRGGIVSTAQLHDLTSGVLHHVTAGDEISIAQPHFVTWRQPKKLLRRVLHEIIALDIELPAKRHTPRAGARIIGMVDRFEFLNLSFRIVLDHDLERPQYCHPALRGLVQNLADAEFEHADIDDAVGLGNADALDEFPDRGWRYAAPLHPRNRGHARIVPAGHMATAHEFGQNTLRQQRI